MEHAQKEDFRPSQKQTERATKKKKKLKI